MNNNVYIDYEFPEPLSKEEFLKDLKEYKEGNIEARDKLIIHNYKLILKQVLNKFGDTPYEKEDLISIGVIGLIKAIDTFDITKNIAFSTYATRCINNEIFMYIRKEKKYLKDIKLEDTISLNDNDEVKLEYLIADKNSDFNENYYEKELYEEVRREVDKLDGRNKEIVKLYFGFYNNIRYSQEEIGALMNIHRTNISHMIHREIKKIEKNLIAQNFIESKTSSKIKKYNK